MTFGAAAAWAPLAALMLTLASASPAVAETTAAAMTAFGLTGTWSEDCTKDPAKEGARLTYSPPEARTPSYLFVLFDNNGNKITFSADILSADRLPQDELKTVTVKTGRNGDATALQPWERIPVETIIVKVGPKIQSMQSRQINGGRRFIVDGQIVAENSRGELQTIKPAPLLEKCGS
ncbi:MAG TPA: hypothetical protein VEK82_13385 [Stellaceae bacterium]|nr:hypothetical protein [Stellaceae bacterium]